jgi:HEAT repeat protein
MTAFLIAFLLLALFVGIRQVIATNDAWREEASQLGLHFTMGGVFRTRRIEGKIQGYPVLVEIFAKDGTTCTRMTLDSRGRIPSGIELRAEGSWVTKVFTGEDILTGDEAFDAAVNVSGPEPIAVAFLGQEARTSVSELLAAGGSVRQGCIHLESKGAMSGEGDIRWAAELLLGLVSVLPGGTMLEHVLANATGDGNPGVRLRNLKLLAEKFRSEEETKRAALAALADPEPAIRLFAATFVKGGQGLAVLKELLENAAVPDDVRVDAVRAAGASRDPALLELLYALVPKRDPALAAAVATALGQLGKAEAETSLLRLMSRESTEVKRAAAAALGLLGTVRAVEPLLQLAAGPLGETARDAVRRIQARLGGDAQAGRLSVAAQDAAAGGLSIAAEGGELSVAEDDKAAEDPSPPRGRVKG